MLLYFEFEGKRRKADVSWPKDKENIVVHVTDKELTKGMPSDLFFEVEERNKITFTIEDVEDKRLTELQNVIARRLQEFITKS